MEGCARIVVKRWRPCFSSIDCGSDCLFRDALMKRQEERHALAPLMNPVYEPDVSDATRGAHWNTRWNGSGPAGAQSAAHCFPVSRVKPWNAKNNLHPVSSLCPPLPPPHCLRPSRSGENNDDWNSCLASKFLENSSRLRSRLYLYYGRICITQTSR